MRRFLLISLWFEFLWLLAVLGQERWQWVMAGLVAMTFAVHLPRPAVALGRILLIAACGIAADYANLAFGLFSFTFPQLPVWLMGLWLAFAWFAGFAIPTVSHLPRCVVLTVTALGGTLSYWAGNRFGAVQFNLSVFYTLLALFLEWLVLSWLLIKVFSNENPTRKRSTLPDRHSVDRRR